MCRVAGQVRGAAAALATLSVAAAGDPGGENYGWNVMEGMHCYNSSNGVTTGLVPLIYDYGHRELYITLGSGDVYRIAPQ
jgi:hypothetical protein